MFYGSVPAEAQAIMNKIVKTWDVSDVYVGCSGNFTLERFIGPMEKFRLHSNDVTMYSRCLGAYYMREHVPLELSEAGLEQFPWLTEYMRRIAIKSQPCFYAPGWWRSRTRARIRTTT